MKTKSITRRICYHILCRSLTGTQKATSYFIWKVPKISIYLGRAPQDLQSFHQDVNKLLKDIDGPVNEDELSGDENELLVSAIFRFIVSAPICIESISLG